MPDAPTLTAAEAAALEHDWHTMRVLDGLESEAWLRDRGEAVPARSGPVRAGGVAKDGEGVTW